MIITRCVNIEAMFAVVCLNKFLFNNFNPAAQNFECPSNKGFFPDSVQCDKYYECQEGIAKERICPDGLVFDENIKRVGKCDQPFNVEFGDRIELRKYWMNF